MRILRISAYELNTNSSHVIVQFEDNEIGNLNRKLRSFNLSALKEILRDSFRIDITSISLAHGAMIYRDKVLDMTYMRIELDDGSIMIFEIYNESAFILTNMNALESLAKVQRVLKCLDPNLRLRTKFNILIYHT